MEPCVLRPYHQYESVALVNLQISLPLDADCMGSGGSFAYRGVQSTTVSGKTCQKWSVDTPQANTYSTYYTTLPGECN